MTEDNPWVIRFDSTASIDEVDAELAEVGDDKGTIQIRLDAASTLSLTDIQNLAEEKGLDIDIRQEP